jgi:hypothetical protein
VVEDKGDDALRASLRALLGFASPILARVIETFPTYTLHDATHAANVAERVADLLGPRLGELEASEAAFLILAAYFHDIGMVWRREDIAEIAREREWESFLKANDAAYIAVQEAEDGIPEEIVEWYCRWRHADRVFVYLNGDAFPAGDALWGTVDIREVLGVLCRSHNETTGDILRSDVLATDFLDEADLKFCAVLLRLADILDFDRTRAPDAIYGHLGLARRTTRRVEASDVEWRKHLHSDGFRFPPKPGDRAQSYTLGFVAGPDHPAVEHDLREFLDTIEQEFAECAHLLRSCSDRWRDFVLPDAIRRSNIRGRGYRYGEYRFTLSQEHILTLLMGENLYESRQVFVREVIQNAIDASRLRERFEWARGNAGFRSAPIRVSEWVDRDGYQWVRFDDEGVGMDERIIREHLLKVGSSYYTSAQFRAELLRAAGSAGQAFVPISRFGIGLLSCFMACDKVEVSTLRSRPDGTSGDPIRLSLNGLHNFFVLQAGNLKADPMPSDGTRREDAEGYRRRTGTSIACRYDPRKGAPEEPVRELLDRVVLLPPVPIEVGGENLVSDNDLLRTPLVEPLDLPVTWNKRQDEPPLAWLRILPFDITPFAPTTSIKGQGFVVYLVVRMPDGSASAGEHGFPVDYMLDLRLVRPGRVSAEIAVPGYLNVRGDGRPRPDPAVRQAVRSHLFPDTSPAGTDFVRATLEFELARSALWRRIGAWQTDWVSNLGRFGPRRNGAFIAAHNGVRLPPLPGRLVGDYGSFSGTGVLVLGFSDDMRLELDASRARLQAVSWPVRSATDLALARAARASLPPLEFDPALFEGVRTLGLVDSTGDWGAGGLALGAVLADPLLFKADGWRVEPLFTLGDEPASLDDLLGAAASETSIDLTGWINDVLSAPLVSARTAQVIATALIQTSFDLVLENVAAEADAEEAEERLRVVATVRTEPLTEGERMFPPLFAIAFADESILFSFSYGLNRRHPFTAWLFRSAPVLSSRYPGLMRQLRHGLDMHRRPAFDPSLHRIPADLVESAIGILLTETNAVLDRLAGLDPTLAVPPAHRPTPGNVKK